MAPTRSGSSPPRSPHRQLPLRQPWSALLLAGVAIVSFVVFEAMDLDGLALALLAPGPASVLDPTLRDPEAAGWHTRPSEPFPIAPVRVPNPAGPAGPASHRARMNVLCPWHLPGPHAAPASADPL